MCSAKEISCGINNLVSALPHWPHFELLHENEIKYYHGMNIYWIYELFGFGVKSKYMCYVARKTAIWFCVKIPKRLKQEYRTIDLVYCLCVCILWAHKQFTRLHWWLSIHSQWKKHRTFFKVWRICSKTGWLFIRTWKYQRQNKYKYGAVELPNALNWYHSSNRFRNQNQIHPIVYRYYLFWLLEHWAVSIQHPTGIITIHLACACVYRYRTLSRQC